jgi:hypothetical protein
VQGSADSVPKPCKLALGSGGGIVIIFRGDDLPPLWGKEMEREWRLAPGVRKRRWGLVLYNSSETSGSKNSFPDTSPSHADGNCKRSRSRIHAQWYDVVRWYDVKFSPPLS